MTSRVTRNTSQGRVRNSPNNHTELLTVPTTGIAKSYCHYPLCQLVQQCLKSLVDPDYRIATAALDSNIWRIPNVAMRSFDPWTTSRSMLRRLWRALGPKKEPCSDVNKIASEHQSRVIQSRCMATVTTRYWDWIGPTIPRFGQRVYYARTLNRSTLFSGSDSGVCCWLRTVAEL